MYTTDTACASCIRSLTSQRTSQRDKNKLDLIKIDNKGRSNYYSLNQRRESNPPLLCSQVVNETLNIDIWPLARPHNKPLLKYRQTNFKPLPFVVSNQIKLVNSKIRNENIGRLHGKPLKWSYIRFKTPKRKKIIKQKQILENT